MHVCHVCMNSLHSQCVCYFATCGIVCVCRNGECMDGLAGECGCIERGSHYNASYDAVIVFNTRLDYTQWNAGALNHMH